MLILRGGIMEIKSINSWMMRMVLLIILGAFQMQLGFSIGNGSDDTGVEGKRIEAPKEYRAQKQRFHIEEWEKGLNRRQPPVKIMDSIGLKLGMVVGEIGAGTGRMTMWLASRVGPSGIVYANDIDTTALEHLRKRCERDGFQNVEIITGEVEDPKFPDGVLDIAFMINVYHHLDNPIPLVSNILPGLKPDGILAIVECTPEKVDWGDDHGCAHRKDMIKQLKEAGFEVVRIETFLDEDNIYIARASSSTSFLEKDIR
jgi:SAM-dependent methyltransferase